MGIKNNINFLNDLNSLPFFKDANNFKKIAINSTNKEYDIIKNDSKNDETCVVEELNLDEITNSDTDFLFENNVNNLINRGMSFSPDIKRISDEVKSDNFSIFHQEMYNNDVSNVLFILSKQSINIDPSKILYVDKSKANITDVYLSNGLIVSLVNDNIKYIKDIDNEIEYELEKDNNYKFTNVKLNYNHSSIVEFNVNKNGLAITDLKEDVILANYSGNCYIKNIKTIGNEKIIYLSNDSIVYVNEDKIKVVDVRERLNEIAKNEIGNNGSKYRKWFYDYDQSTPWCAVFISWLFDQLGGDKQYFSKLDDNGNEAKGQDGAGDFARKSVKNEERDDKCYGNWYESEYTDSSTEPQVGDIIMFNPTIDPWDKYVSRHVGYVYKVDSEKVYTIEGNVGSDDDSSYVDYREYPRNSDDINGYYRPNY